MNSENSVDFRKGKWKEIKPRHVTVKMLKVKVKEKVLQAVIEKSIHTY